MYGINNLNNVKKIYLKMELKGCKSVCLKFCYIWPKTIIVKMENLENLN
jgi:hypothetical protein